MSGVSYDVRLEWERALFREMTHWPTAPAMRPWLTLLLGELCRVVNGARAWFELHLRDGGTMSLSWECTPEQEERIRAEAATERIATAIATGRAVHGLSVGGVSELWVPFDVSLPGVLYVETEPGGRWTEEDLELVKHVTQFLGPVLQHSSPRTEGRGRDPTSSVRSRMRLEGLAGSSRALANVFEQLALVAPLDITVLLTGESGTGKTQLARALHDNSPRRDGPFVELNCAAIPSTIFESELFGTRDGAFTGARKLPGKLAAAEGGTLLLDEIGELPLAVQAKLLQLLQSKQYYPLGSSSIATANIRLIAATNASLPELVEQKRFREDLFYRLNTFTIRMPSLAERPEDISPILDALQARLTFELSLPTLPLSTAFRVACETMEWPGNVRQLSAALQRALIRAVGEHAPQVEARHLEDERPLMAPEPQPGPESFAAATRHFQRELLKRELERCEWNVTEVARRLDVTRSHVYNLLRSFGLQRKG
ncbi:MAG: sigma-54 interaction domain-containing protein [Myxococcota bacterium]